MPILIVTVPAVVNENVSTFVRICSAKRIAFSALVSGSRTTNSSPPRRAKTSVVFPIFCSELQGGADRLTIVVLPLFFKVQLPASESLCQHLSGLMPERCLPRLLSADFLQSQKLPVAPKRCIVGINDDCRVIKGFQYFEQLVVHCGKLPSIWSVVHLPGKIKREIFDLSRHRNPGNLGYYINL